LFKNILIGSLVGLLFIVGGTYFYDKVINRPLAVGDSVRGKINYNLKRDGDTFALVGYNKDRFRLIGIDAPEYKQNCVRGDNKVWACGMKSIEALDSLIKNDRVFCDLTKKDIYPNRWDVVCTVRGIEINDWMVRQGWALAYVQYSKKYVKAQEEAKLHQRGMWADNGKLQNPWDFRKEQKSK